MVARIATRFPAEAATRTDMLSHGCRNSCDRASPVCWQVFGLVDVGSPRLLGAASRGYPQCH